MFSGRFFRHIFPAFLALVLCVELTAPAAEAAGKDAAKTPVSATELSSQAVDSVEGSSLAENASLSADFTSESYAETQSALTQAQLLDLNDSRIVAELPELREACSPRFRLTDGSFAAVTYDHAVHEQDAAGNWLEIDNTLKTTTAEDGTLQYERSGRTSAVAFYTSASKSGLYCLQSETGSLSWGLAETSA